MADNEQEIQQVTDLEEENENKNRSLISLVIVLSIIFYLLPSLLAFLFVGKPKLSGFEYKTVVALLNFEIYFVIISIALSCLVGFIAFPIFGVFIHGLLTPVLFFINLVICIKSLQSFNKGEVYTYPIDSPLIK